MGRWAQARKRGGGGPGVTPAFALTPPVPETDFNVSVSGFEIDGNGLATCVASALLYRIAEHGTDDWEPAVQGPCDEATTIVLSAPSGFWDVQAAWSDGVSQVSDWSDTVNVEV